MHSRRSLAVREGQELTDSCLTGTPHQLGSLCPGTAALPP